MRTKPPKENNMSMNDTDERRAAVWTLLQAQRKEKKKECVAVPILKGYKFVEKSKYEREYLNQQNIER